MARIRTIKPDFPHSESMGRVSRDARLLFVMLFTIVDDEGRARAARNSWATCRDSVWRDESSSPISRNASRASPNERATSMRMPAARRRGNMWR